MIPSLNEIELHCPLLTLMVLLRFVRLVRTYNCPLTYGMNAEDKRARPPQSVFVFSVAQKWAFTVVAEERIRQHAKEGVNDRVHPC